MEKIRWDYKKCITATTWNENECNDDARPPSLFLEDFPYRTFFSFCSVLDVTVIHYYKLPNANARINIYYIGVQSSRDIEITLRKYSVDIIMQHLASQI